MNLGIVGSRSLIDHETNLKIIRHALLELQSHGNFPVKKVISGGAVGVDTSGSMFASSEGIPIQIFYPDWNRYGRSAGFERNTFIAANSDILICIWDGISRGCMDTVVKFSNMCINSTTKKANVMVQCADIIKKKKKVGVDVKIRLTIFEEGKISLCQSTRIQL